MPEDPPLYPHKLSTVARWGEAVRSEDHVCNQSCMGALRIFQASGIGYWPSGFRSGLS